MDQLAPANNQKIKTEYALVEVFRPQEPPSTETRLGTVQGCGGHYQCRRIPVTLPYSGALARAA